MMGSARNYWEGLVGLAGLEPAARGLGNLCSVRLSYRPLNGWRSDRLLCCDYQSSLSGSPFARTNGAPLSYRPILSDWRSACKPDFSAAVRVLSLLEPVSRNVSLEIHP